MTRILLVDDDKENLKDFRRKLEEHDADWSVTAVSTQREALSAIEGAGVDVILSDLILDGTESVPGGMQVLKRAREIDALATVILYTASIDRMERYKAFAMGAFDCIEKLTPGLRLGDELTVKTKAALVFRQSAHLQGRLGELRRYFAPQVWGAIENDRNLLALRTQIVTICFWDIRGFSKLCERLKTHPDLIAAFLSEYFAAVDSVVFRNGGVLDKFIGDGVMALFQPMTNANEEAAAVAAVSAARDLLPRFEAIVTSFADRWDRAQPGTIKIGVGCGIHTGEALVGNIGPPERIQYTALGPAVNLAQRFEAKARPGEILMSKSTKARVEGQIMVQRAGTLVVKGFEEDFEGWHLPPTSTRSTPPRRRR